MGVVFRDVGEGLVLELDRSVGVVFFVGGDRVGVLACVVLLVLVI